MTLDLSILANAPVPPADNSGAIITGFVVAVIGAVFAGLANLKGRRDGRAESVKIEPQPLAVKMEDHFVTRREFDLLRTEVTTGFAKAEALINRMTERVDAKHHELLATIERAAKTGTDGRVALWNELRDEKDRVNNRIGELGQRIAKTEACREIGRSIERGFESLTLKRTTRG